MDIDLERQIQQRLAELPADVQTAIRSSDQGPKLQTIGKKYNLHVDQIGKLEDETLLVMLGFADPGEFSEHLIKELSVAPQEAVAIATDVSNEIFMPIRASMQAWAEDRAERESANVITDTLGKEAPVPTKLPPTAPAPGPIAAVKAAPIPSLGAAEAMLSEKKITPPAQTAPEAPASASSATPAASPAPKADPAQPQNYKADPYREPIE
jgi:hypothetical protein